MTRQELHWLWILWRHQGAYSTIGQDMRKHLGMSQFQRLSDEQIKEVKRYEKNLPKINRNRKDEQ